MRNLDHNQTFSRPGSVDDPHTADGPHTVGEQALDDVARLRAENDQLRSALAARPIIDQAKGVLMARYAIGADAAFAVLRRWSQDTNIKLRTIAEHLLLLVDDDTPADTRTDQNLLRWLRTQLHRRPSTNVGCADPGSAAATGGTDGHRHHRADQATPVSTEFHVLLHGPQDWQVSRNGERIGIYSSQSAAIRAALDRARQEQPCDVVIHDDHGHAYARYGCQPDHHIEVTTPTRQEEATHSPTPAASRNRETDSLAPIALWPQGRDRRDRWW